jgi:hypothetical protein
LFQVPLLVVSAFVFGRVKILVSRMSRIRVQVRRLFHVFRVAVFGK